MPALQSVIQAMSLFELKQQFEDGAISPKKLALFKTEDEEIMLVVKANDNHVYIFDIADISRDFNYCENSGEFTLYSKKLENYVHITEYISPLELNKQIDSIIAGESNYYGV